MRNGSTGRILWMLKAPEVGRVKTRLAEAVGAKKAREVYVRLVEWSWKRLGRHFPGEVHFDPPEAEAAMRAWLGGEVSYYRQEGGDLGERLTWAVASAFRRSGEPLLVVGGDCPYLERSHAMAAFRGLSRADVVLGPALDGGYVLIAMKTEEPALFEGIPWSTGSVLEATLERARACGLTVKQLAPLEDVDELSSWERARRVLGL